MFRRVFPYVAGAVVVGAIAAGLALIGPPSEERRRRLDAIRVGDLRQISTAVDMYWKQEARVPESLAAVPDVPNAAFRRTMDPATGEPYPYRVLDGSRYELCATFEAEDADGAYDDRFWAHGAGRRCFELDAAKRPSR
jgi:hypothetical protein